VPPSERPEAFGPFVRVTNSYNGVRALRFEIGMSRKVCQNGLMLPDALIHFRFNHARQDIGQCINFAVDHRRLAESRSHFIAYMNALRACKTPRVLFHSLVMTALNVRRPATVKPGTPAAECWDMLDEHVEKLNEAYATELGENAYAVFNVITDLASHPPESRFFRREHHGLQRLAGKWLVSFSKRCREPNFSLVTFLGELANQWAQAGSADYRRAITMAA
jgi:hypothetical protein